MSAASSARKNAPIWPGILPASDHCPASRSKPTKPVLPPSPSRMFAPRPDLPDERYQTRPPQKPTNRHCPIQNLNPASCNRDRHEDKLLFQTSAHNQKFSRLG